LQTGLLSPYLGPFFDRTIADKTIADRTIISLV